MTKVCILALIGLLSGAYGTALAQTPLPIKKRKFSTIVSVPSQEKKVVPIIRVPEKVRLYTPEEMIKAVRSLTHLKSGDLKGWTGLERDKDGSTFLHYACRYGSLDLVTALFENSKVRIEDTKLVNSSSETLLHSASIGNNLAVLEYLLQHRTIALETPNILGQTPLFYACNAGHEAVARALIDHGAQVNALDNEGATPLHFASYEGHLGIVKLLDAYKADLSALSSVNTTPLHNAAIRGHLEIVAFLIARGVRVNLAPPASGITALHEASLYGHLLLVRLLLVAGADINSCATISRVTPLMNACWKRQRVVVRELLSQSPLLDAQDDDGDTALHYACQQNDEILIKLLLAKGASKTLHNNLEQKPIDLLPPYSPNRKLFQRKSLPKQHLSGQDLAIKKLPKGNEHNSLSTKNRLLSILPKTKPRPHLEVPRS